LEAFALILLALCVVLGFSLIFFTTFGTLVILAGACFFALATDFLILRFSDIIIILSLYLLGEISEYVFVMIGAKKFGASNWAMVGALAGGILGALFGAVFFGVGIIAGTFLGIFFGAFFAELIVKKDSYQSIKAGLGGVIGRMGSIIVKLMIAVCMAGIILIRILKV